MADLSANVYEIVSRQRKALLAREYKTVQYTLRAYERAEARIVKELERVQKKLMQAHLTGTDISLAWVYQEARLENLVREVRLAMSDFAKDALEFTEAGQADSFKLGAVHAAQLGEASVVGDFAGLHHQAFQNAQHLLHQESPLAHLFEAIAPTAVTATRQVFAEAVALGWNPRKTGRALKSKIEGLAKNRAILIARTEQIRAYRMATAETFTQNADVLRGWRWTSARTEATCPMCIALDGSVWPVGSVMHSHPACRCAMVPLPNTAFPMPEIPTSGEWFDTLDAKTQDKMLGKAKGQLYREGKITLGDNVKWHDDPEWGPSPRARSLPELRTMREEGTLPSLNGSPPLSGFTPKPAKSLAEVLATPSPVKIKAPEEEALEKWLEQKQNGKERKIGLPSVRGKKYEVPADLKPFLDDSDIEEVPIAHLHATRDYASDAKVQAYIKALGDGEDLPWVVRHEGKFYVHNADSVARLEAKRLLGQTKATVRVFDTGKFTKSPVDEAKAELLGLGVKNVFLQPVNITAEEQVEAMQWAANMIRTTGYVPDEVTVGSATYSAGGDLWVGPPSHHVEWKPTEQHLRDYLKTTNLWGPTLQSNAALAEAKAETLSFLHGTADEVKAEFYLNATSGLPDGEAEKDALADWGDRRYKLFSLKAFTSTYDLDATYQEAVIAYDKGLYRLGSLPESIEKPMLKAFEKTVGKRAVLPAYEGDDFYLAAQTKGQGGSNPGGEYMGIDGKKRYVKFYPQAQRAEVEQVANSLYRFLGVDVPETTLFDHNGKTAFASEIIEGTPLSTVGVVKTVADKVLDGYVADALLANWDVAGATDDNILLGADNKVYRIDAGGSLIFRAQGGPKDQFALTNVFEEWTSLGTKSSKGYVGQLSKYIAKSSYGTYEGFAPKMVEQGEAALKRLNVLLGSGSDADQMAKALKFIKSQAPKIGDSEANLIARMLVNRRKLLEDKVKETKAFIKTLGKPPKAAKLPKSLAEVLKVPEPQKLSASMRTTEYEQFVKDRFTPAFKRMDGEAKKAAVKYSGSSYNTYFNAPAREGKMNADIVALDKAIVAHKEGLPEDMIVWRKVGSKTGVQWREFDDTAVGTLIGDKGFLSTAIHEGVWSGNTHLKIILRKGEKRCLPPALTPASGASTATTGHHPSEHELILGRDLKMLVRKVEKNVVHDGQKCTLITVEVLPEDFVLPKGTVIQYAQKTWQKIKNLVTP